MPSFIDEQLELTKMEMADVRAIVHALKMATLSYVEEEALTEIKQLIESLPSAERINQLASTPEGLKDVREKIGYILNLIDTYGKRGAEFKARYKAKTKLPPRYKVMEWRSAMKKEAMGFIKELIRISSEADDKGDFKVATKLITCAKAVRSEDIKEEDIVELIDVLKSAGYDKESLFIKEAQVGSYLKGLWQGVKDVGGNIASALLDPARLQKTRAKLDQVIKSIQPELQYVNQVIPKTKNPQMLAQMQSIQQALGQMSQLGQQAVSSLDQAQQSVAQQPTQQAQQPQAQQAQQTQTEQAGQTSQNPTAEPGKRYFYKDKNYPIQFDSRDNAFIDTPDGKLAIKKNPDGRWAVTPYDAPTKIPLPTDAQGVQDEGLPMEKTPTTQPVPQPGQSATVTNKQGTQSKVNVVKTLPNGMVQVQYPGNKLVAVNPSQLQLASTKVFNLKRFSAK